MKENNVFSCHSVYDLLFNLTFRSNCHNKKIASHFFFKTIKLFSHASHKQKICVCDLAQNTANKGNLILVCVDSLIGAKLR